MDEIHLMNAALREAAKAILHDDVPVGALVVLDGKIIARAHNEREKRNDPTAHAEILALSKAGKKARGMESDRRGIVRDARAMSDVRRRDNQRPNQKAGLRGERPQGGMRGHSL
jgi:Cytosine/adenosine deaminases